jgi:hypothetical protein
MANSTQPGPAGSQHHRHRHRHPHTADVPPKALPPATTPGSQGRKDQSDPTWTSLLGWTPNVTGLKDWADHTLHEAENWWHKTLGGIGVDKQSGAPVAHGSAAPTAPAGELNLDEAHLLALRITTVFEGEGGKSMDYTALAGDGDGQATSFGIVQFNFGRGTLGRLLNKMRTADTATFDGCFTADSNFEDLKATLATNDKKAQRKWALDLFKSKEGTQAWRTSFKKLGAVDAFNKIQVDSAINNYNPTVSSDIEFLRSLAPALMAKVEFRSYAALFDCAIQQGGLSKANAEIRAKVASDKPATQFALMTIALTERANRASQTSVADCLSRRLSILNGKRLSFTAYGQTYNRANAQYSIVLTEGAKTIVGL